MTTKLQQEANAKCPLARYCHLPGTTERGCTLACRSETKFDVAKWRAERAS